MRAMDWSELPYFLAVAREGSLRAAAESLGATHATVNRHIQALEASYGVRLFDRDPRGLRLTSAGEDLLPIAQEAELVIVTARRRVEGLDREVAGTVRVTVPPVLGYDVLGPIFSRFMHAHPEVELDVTLTNRKQNLSRAEADVSIRVSHAVDDDVLGRRVLQYARAIYASQSYLDHHIPQAGIGGDGLHWIGWYDEVPTPNWIRESPYPKAALRHRVRDGLMVGRLVAEGHGISYLPCYYETLVDGLVRVPGAPVELDRSIWLLLHSDLRRTKRVRLFVDHVAKELKAMRSMFLGSLA